MTDGAPMEPDYRRRMEAAEAELARLRQSTVDLNMLIDKKDRELVGLSARADAAEQRVDQLNLECDKFRAMIAVLAEELESTQARADAAEAREQALRDRVSELEAALNAVLSWASGEPPAPSDYLTVAERANQKAGYVSAQTAVLELTKPWWDTPEPDPFRPPTRALLSPPTADTEESDRG